LATRRIRITRRRPQRQPRKRFLVFCEGEVTERDYFNYWRRSLRSRLIQIEISPQRGDPLKLVEHAISAKRAAEREARSERDDNLLYDEVWCITDVDEHERLDEARQKAGPHGVRLAVSDPCFELWGLLHYQDQWAHITCSAVGDALKRHFPQYNKRLDCDGMRPIYPQARTRAVELDTRRARDNGGSNPSTNVWQLVDELIRSNEAQSP
jgi:RloB-like protein